jgi:hypothetical protein
MMARVLTVGLICVAKGAALRAQPIRGSVIAGIGDTPVGNAAVLAKRSATAASADRLGRFTIQVPLRPDTLVIAAIGWFPDTVIVADSAESVVVVRLEKAPVVISDLLATAPASRPLHLDDVTHWRMPVAAARTIPPAVETDIYRALAVIPAVSFSSPLSARPAIRGFDAQEVTTRIDGFEVLNLYHLGRIFSSFPADAADEIRISAPPSTSSQGGSVAGVIDVAGRTGRVDGFHAGGSWSFGSLTGSAGGGTERVRAFGAARLFYWKSLELIPDVDVPYHFEDFYAGVVFGAPDRPRARLTLFGTQDRAGDLANASYLNWNNVLVGGRWRILDRGATSLELTGSAARFSQRGEDVPGLHSVTNADLTNRFARVAASIDLTTLGHRTRFATGLAVGRRQVDNRIVDVPSGGQLLVDQGVTPDGLVRADVSIDRLEVGGYAEISRRVGRITLEAGTRVDGAGPVISVQPRLHASWAPGAGIEISAAVGRTSRLYHLLAEPRSEPDFDFLDFWLSAGGEVPTAMVDHGAVDLDLDFGPILARLSAYSSRGRGIGELRPEVDQRPSHFEFFRFGRSRGWGLEAQLGYRGSSPGGQAFSVSYTLAKAERDWGNGWVAWSLDRRHQLRGFGQVRARGLTLFGALDIASGLPLTAVEFRYLDPETRYLHPADRLVYGRENEVATSGTFRLDFGLAYSFGGPDSNRFTFGVSVINLLGTAVAPIALDAEGSPAFDQSGRLTRYGRLFDLPPVPTITLRAEL